jgi:NADPH:quinone reductase-like Zn-dependent oxidoreductase
LAGLNPIDWMIHQYGIFVTEFPAVIGYDAAGVIEDVGAEVSGYAKGDKVYAAHLLPQRAFSNILCD